MLVLLHSNTQAQKFGGGGYFGVVASQISGDQLAGFNKAGLDLGFFTNLTSNNKKISLQLELAYLQKGSRDNANPDKGDYVSYLLRLNYAEISLLARYNASNIFSFEAGPAIGYLFNVVERDQYGELPNTNLFKKSDLNIIGGIHYNVNQNIKIVFRAANSLLPVRKHKGGGTYRLNKGQYNSLLSLTLHYTFKIKSEQNE
ncbi:MAG TPA: outer membrane beta-barrel protein [Bacteroidales bacterium]|nr:outer membrane beta-barrel protein [Bacteroidales bacterium]